MVYLFLGREQFLKNQALIKLRNKVSLNYEEFQPGEDSLKEFMDNARTAPLTGKYRLLVIKDADSLSPKEKDELAFFMRSKPQTTILTLLAEGLKPQDIIYKTSVDCGRVMNFAPLELQRLHKWVTDRLSQFNKQIDPQAMQVLLGNTNSDLAQLEIAIEMLAAFTGESAVIRQGDVENMTGKNLRATTYQLVDAIGVKNSSLALNILSSLDKDNRIAVQVIGLIGWHLRRIWRAKKASGFSRHSGNFSVKELEKAFKMLLKLDKDIKSTPIAAYRALELLIIQLCAKAS